MANIDYGSEIKCSICGKKDEGIIIGNWLFKFKLCERCISKWFKVFHREK